MLYGPEPMLMRQHLETLRQAIEAEHGPTDTLVFDGQQATLADVFDELRSLSLMGHHKIVVVDNADSFTTAHRQALERYTQAPVDHATLVLRGQRWNRGKLDKQIEAVGGVIKCDPPSGAALRSWLIERSRQHHKRDLSPAAAAALADRLSGDLMQLDSALAKLSVSVTEDGPVLPEHVEKQITPNSHDQKAWAVQASVLAALDRRSTPGRGDRSIIEKIHQLIDQSGQPPVLVTYFVADLIRKLYLGSQMRRQGRSEQLIAQQFKLWGPQRAAFMQVLDQLDTPTVAGLFDEIVRQDARAKSGLGSSIRNLECFCATLDRPNDPHARSNLAHR